MIKIIGVRFRNAGKIYYFDPKKLPVKKGDHVSRPSCQNDSFQDVFVATALQFLPQKVRLLH